jgi:DNA-binding NarL/FixJ family response regulator
MTAVSGTPVPDDESGQAFGRREAVGAGPEPDGRIVRVLLVEDHAMVAEGLSVALNAQPDLEVVGWISTVGELGDSSLLDPANPSCPDVALVDYHLPDGTGADVAAIFRERCPATRIVIVSASRTEAELLKAVEAGCVGFVDKRSRVDDLTRVVRAAARGEASFDAGLLRSLVLGLGKEESGAPGSDLSEREREVLRLLAAGLSTEAMADQLYLSTHTVRNHIRNLTAKLGAHSRLEAVAIAARVGLVTLVGPPV